MWDMMSMMSWHFHDLNLRHRNVFIANECEQNSIPTETIKWCGAVLRPFHTWGDEHPFAINEVLPMRMDELQISTYNDLSGWWFGTCFSFPISCRNNHPNWLSHIFQRGRYTTTNQLCIISTTGNLLAGWQLSPVCITETFDAAAAGLRFQCFSVQRWWLGQGSKPMVPYLGWTSMNPSYFDVNYRGRGFWPITNQWCVGVCLHTSADVIRKMTRKHQILRCSSVRWGKGTGLKWPPLNEGGIMINDSMRLMGTLFLDMLSIPIWNDGPSEANHFREFHPIWLCGRRNTRTHASRRDNITILFCGFLAHWKV